MIKETEELLESLSMVRRKAQALARTKNAFTREGRVEISALVQIADAAILNREMVEHWDD